MNLKAFYLVLFALSLFLMGKSQSEQPYRVLENNYQRIKLSYNSNPLTFNEVQTDKGVFTQIQMKGFGVATSVGNPALPVLPKMIEVPLCESIQVQIISKDSIVIPLSEQGVSSRLYPAQPSYSKSDEGPFPLIINENIYAQNAFYGEPLVSAELTGVARNVNIGIIYFSPVKYNPVTQEIIVYTQVEVEVTFAQADIAATERMKQVHRSPLFVAASKVINPIGRERDHLLAAPVKYLIVAHSSFRGQLDQFIAWKKRKGFLVEVGYTDQVGTTTTSIAAYIKSFYTNATELNPAPLYVLLVGDVAQIPAFSGTTDTHASDLYYFTWTSGDNIPDCYFGRFSAQNTAQLTPQIDKTLMYEQYTMSDPTYLDEAVLIAGEDGGSQGDFGYTHANPAMHYAADQYVNQTYGYTTVNAFYNPHASTSTSVIANLLKKGVGFANYSAHCNSTLWGDPAFTTSDVAAMTNVQKMGLMIGNCCLSNKFDDGECFGESVLRKGNYSGAVGYIGGSNSTYWDEDYYWAVGLRSIDGNGTVPSYNANNLGALDRLFHTHSESFANWYTTNGAMMMAGNMAVQSSTSSSSMKLYYWEIYHLMGDPSVMTWLTQASPMTVTANNTLFVGATSLAVQAVPYAYVALTDTALNLVVAGFADATGAITLNFNALTAPGNYELVASAQNYQTYFQPVNVILAAGPYVVANNLNLSNGSLPQEGNVIQWDLTLENIGINDATNVYAELSESSPYLTLSDNRDTLALLATGQSQQLPLAFSGQIAARVSDQTTIPLTVTVYYDVNQSQVYNFNIVVNSPNLIRVNYAVSEISGNGDNYVDPGENISLAITNQNNGHASLNGVVSQLYTYYNQVVISTPQLNMGVVAAGANTQPVYSISINPSVPDGTLIPFYHRIYGGNTQLLDTFYIFVGKAMEDFESNSFTTFTWSNGSNPWSITTSNKYEGTYSARSKQYLSNSSTSNLSITWTSTINDSISFYRKVSSEANYDFFKFYIDGTLMESLSGEVAWSRTSFPVVAGTHTFRFTYAKDQYATDGSDCALIDFITFPQSGTIPINTTPQARVIFTNATLNSGISPDNNATLSFDLSLQNIGDTTAYNVWCEVTSPSSYVLISDYSDSTIYSLQAGTTYNFIPHFSVQLADFIPDQTVIPLLFIVHYGYGEKDSISLQLTANAPVLGFVNYQFNEITGNGDAYINPGEVFEVSLVNSNVGHAPITQVNSLFSSDNSLVAIANPLQSISLLNTGGQSTLNYMVTFDQNLTNGTFITFEQQLTKNLYQLTTSFSIPIIDETGNSISDWKQGAEISLYPNPTSSTLTVRANELISAVEIIDLTGKIVQTQSNIFNEQVVLNVNSLSSGIYFLRLTNQQEEISYKKFIKQP